MALAVVPAHIVSEMVRFGWKENIILTTADYVCEFLVISLGVLGAADDGEHELDGVSGERE